MPTSVRRLPRWRPLASGSCAPMLEKRVGVVSTSFSRVRTSFDRCQPEALASSPRLRVPTCRLQVRARGRWIFRWATRSWIVAGLQLAWRAPVARGARALRRQYPTPGWALARSTRVLPCTNANACSHTLTHPSARAQVCWQRHTRLWSTLEGPTVCVVSSHSHPSPAHVHTPAEHPHGPSLRNRLE